jgi:hypothetical protein
MIIFELFIVPFKIIKDITNPMIPNKTCLACKEVVNRNELLKIESLKLNCNFKIKLDISIICISMNNKPIKIVIRR